MQAAEPYGRPRDFLARMAGLGRPVLWSLATTSVLGVAAAVAAGSWALYETRHAADAVQRYVVYVDGQTVPVGQARIDAAWTPGPGAYVDFARRWVRFLRSRPTDIETLKYQRREVIRTTDARVYAELQESMRKADDELRQSALDVLSISANLVDSGPGRAVVLARWTEQARNAAGAAPVAWTATLTLTYQEPRAQAELERNPLGIYVTSFQISQESR
jgi:type IV secretory pathway TrbF-like protein